jgi:hypothetical protein
MDSENTNGSGERVSGSHVQDAACLRGKERRRKLSEIVILLT